MAEEGKNDIFLKRLQITIAILAGTATLIVGIYNIKKNVFTKEEPPPVVSTPSRPQVPEKIQSALDEVGASWIKKLSSKESGQSTAQ